MPDTPPPEPRVPTLRAFAAGILMGLANLVPGISGGTMILAVGLYDRFIGAVADVTRLKLRRESLLFLGTLAGGLVFAVLAFSGLAVAFVGEYRWIAYSLFIGMTLGGAPELVRNCRPFHPGVAVAALAGFGLMVLLALELSGTQLSSSPLVLVGVGALAASSMILPGVSGSYVLLILGMYDLVIGSLSPSAIKEDFVASAWIVGPVVVGAGLGIALLSNVLERLLARYSRASHAALLGLLVGSVVGLYPFREPVNPDLAHKPTRKAVAKLIDGDPMQDVLERYGAELDPVHLAELRDTYADKTPGDLKRLGEELRRFEPESSQVGSALGLAVLGALLTRLLGRRPTPAPDAAKSA